MGRGIMYHITEDPETVGVMDESDFYEYIEALSADYVKNCNTEDARDSIEFLAQKFKAAGFSIEEYTALDEDGNPIGNYPVIKTGDKENTEACIMQYFSASFEKFKKQAQELTLRTFALDTLEANSLRQLINDKYTDAVYYGKSYLEYIYSLDEFVRRMAPNRSYYIRPETVFMH